jgi:hypothetical protein
MVGKYLAAALTYAMMLACNPYTATVKCKTTYSLKVDTLQRRLSSNLHLISEAEVRHRYGRSCISAPKPTIPSTTNTSSPITIQPCNAVMFSSLRIDSAGPTGSSPNHRTPQLRALDRVTYVGLTIGLGPPSHEITCRLVGDLLARKRQQQCPPAASPHLGSSRT